jgi:DNA-binding response OmpR family regulator
MRVLVVEDETLIAMLAEDALIEAGHEVIGPAGSLEEAQELLDRCRPDFAVIDMNLAGVSSLPILERLAMLGVPVVITTGYGMEGVPQRWHRRVLTKPYDLAAMVRMAAEAGSSEEAA